MLPVPGGDAKYLVVVLAAPLRVGATVHHCIVFQIPDDSAIDPANPWKPSGIKSEADLERLFPDKEKRHVTLEMSGPVCQILASVFKTVAQVPLTGENKDFVQAESGTSAVRAQLKGGAGWLFVLKNFMLFLHRPATMISYAGLEIADVTIFGATGTLTLQLQRETGGKEKIALGAITARELTALTGYLQSKGIAMPQVQGEEDGDDEDGEEDEDFEDDSDAGDDEADSDFDDDEGGKKKKHRSEKKDKKHKKEKKDKKHKKEKKDKSAKSE